VHPGILGFSLRSSRVSTRESCVGSQQAMAAIPEAGKAPQGGWPGDQLSPSKLAVPFAVGSGQGKEGVSRGALRVVSIHVCAIRILRCGWRAGWESASRRFGIAPRQKDLQNRCLDCVVGGPGGWVRWAGFQEAGILF
jgi:hypothetical protein